MQEALLINERDAHWSWPEAIGGKRLNQRDVGEGGHDKGLKLSKITNEVLLCYAI